MIKHYCDRCGAEISAESGTERIYFRSHRQEYSGEFCIPCWEHLCLEAVPTLGQMINEAEAKAAAKKAEKLKSKKEMEADEGN